MVCCMLDNFFKFKENGTDFKTEIIAGVTTFLAMAYILGVNPVVLSDGGMPASGVFFATAVASGIACIIMGVVAKYPVGLAPDGTECTVYLYNHFGNGKHLGNSACRSIHFKRNIFDNHYFWCKGSYLEHHPS